MEFDHQTLRARIKINGQSVSIDMGKIGDRVGMEMVDETMGTLTCIVDRDQDIRELLKRAIEFIDNSNGDIIGP